MSNISEIDAIKNIDESLRKLEDDDARDRVLKWAYEKYYSGSSSVAPKKNGIDKNSQDSKSNIEEPEEDDFSVTEIVNSINDSENLDQIESKILNKSNQLNRILLCFYFIDKVYPNESVTTGVIEEITDQLGVKIHKTNIGTKIKDNLKFFAAEDVRKQGSHVHYKINRKGITEFEKLIEDAS